MQSEKHEGGWEVHDSTNFWLNVTQGKLAVRANSQDQIKVHYDYGQAEIMKKSFNVYSTLNFDRTFKDICWKIGAQHVGKVCNSDNRLRVDVGERYNFTWYNHTVLTKCNWVLGLSSYFDLTKG